VQVTDLIDIGSASDDVDLVIHLTGGTRDLQGQYRIARK
jgi:hypothetical protein